MDTALRTPSSARPATTTYLVGLDEAGYGPNLGPLAVAATVWRVDAAGAGPVDLYELLDAAVSQGPCRGRLRIADSKAVYQSASGRLAGLEAAVIPAFRLAGCGAGSWRELTGVFSGCSAAEDPCVAGFDAALPTELSADEAAVIAERLKTAADGAGVELMAVVPRLVFPGEFNRLLELHGTKGAALSHVTLGLLGGVLRSLPDGEPAVCRINCDKHGGRSRYAPLLTHHFPTALVQVVEESRPLSSYRWRSGHREYRVDFRARGESELPTALASMTAKYLRELAMRGFNAFWEERLPGVRPTAGYPLDAKRFWEETARARRESGIDEQQLWRMR